MAILVVLTCALFIWPASRSVARADAVVVLSGDHGERLPAALRLLNAGVSDTLVMAGEPDSPQARELCSGGRTFEVVCLRPQPDSTQAEAQATAVLAEARQWKTLLVVTSTQHATRARLLFRRCVDGNVETVAARPPYGIRTLAGQILHEWGGLLYSLVLNRGC